MEVIAERNPILYRGDGVHHTPLAAEEPYPLSLQCAHLSGAAHERDLDRDLQYTIIVITIIIIMITLFTVIHYYYYYHHYHHQYDHYCDCLYLRAWLSHGTRFLRPPHRKVRRSACRRLKRNLCLVGREIGLHSDDPSKSTYVLRIAGGHVRLPQSVLNKDADMSGSLLDRKKRRKKYVVDHASDERPSGDKTQEYTYTGAPFLSRSRVFAYAKIYRGRGGTSTRLRFLFLFFAISSFCILHILQSAHFATSSFCNLLILRILI